MTANSIEWKKFQADYNRNTWLRPDGQNASTYEGSDVDKYLENEWYNNLSSTMKAAIQATNIKQASYSYPDLKQETGPSGQVYNTISRHAFLPGVDEIGKAVDLKNSDKVKAFLSGESVRTRDSSQDRADSVEFLGDGTGRLNDGPVNGICSVRPAFVIDLSKVDYKVAGHTDYK